MRSSVVVFLVLFVPPIAAAQQQAPKISRMKLGNHRLAGAAP